MKRNRGIDVIRVVAIMSVLVYHFYVLVGGERYLKYPVVHNLISAGGEIGVTLFFIISGYGIYLSIDRQIEMNSFTFAKYMQKRCIRILPQYYLSLLIIIFIGTQGSVISREGMFHIFTHALLIHNFFPSTCGSISTVLWTMGVIFQFYFVAVILHRITKKRPILTLLGTIIFTIVCKVFVFHIVLRNMNADSSYYFIYGRQLFTAIDNFVIGMFIACYKNYVAISKKEKAIVFILLLGAGMMWCVMPQAVYRHSDNFIGYIWCTVLAIILGGLTWLLGSLNYNEKSILIKGVMFISKYQYGIYLWHFVCASNMLQSSSLINGIANHSFFMLTIVLSIICIVVGYISTITLDSPNYVELFKRKNN